jgi:hypothetical protein
MATVINGQLALFGGRCAQCGEVPAYVLHKRQVIRILLCAQCGQVVEDPSFGRIADENGKSRSSHRG